MAAPTTSRQGRFVALDGVRGAAALTVFAFHALSRAVPPLAAAYPAVDFLFVLSGFILSPQLASTAVDGRTHRDQVRRFATKRFVRLWPATVVVLFVELSLTGAQWAVEQIGGDAGAQGAFDGRPLWAWPLALLMLQGFSYAATGWCLPLWSMSATWWVNVLVASLCRLKLHRVAAVGVVVAFAGLALSPVRSMTDADRGAAHWWFLYAFSRAALCFCCGLLARHAHDRFGWGRGRGWLVAAAVVVLGLPPLHLLIGRYLLLVGPFATVVVALAFAHVRVRPGGPVERFCRLSGELSFPLYITHVTVLSALTIVMVEVLGGERTNSLAGQLARAGVGLVLALTASLLLSRRVEPRLSAPLRRRLLPAPAVLRRPAATVPDTM